MKISEVSSHRSGLGSERHTATMSVGTGSGVTGILTRLTTPSVTTASTTVAASPRWTPLRRPYAAIAKPPRVGARAIGTRLRIDCTVNPSARRSLGSASPTTAKSVGLAMLDHAMAKTRPAKTNGHDGATQYSAYPTTASVTKSSRTRGRTYRLLLTQSGYILS